MGKLTAHTELSHIAELARKTRALGPERPVVLAAYPSVLASAPGEQARPALELLLATAFSHGATVLATGESGTVLVDPYYPRHHLAEPERLELLRRMHDVLVRFGDILVGQPIEPINGAVLRLRRECSCPEVFTASPDAPVPARLEGVEDGDADVFALPPLGGWTLVLVRQH